MKTYQLIALALGLAASPLAAQTADEYITQGRTDLTESNLLAANASFTSAVAVSPTNGEANALLAATRLLVLPQQTAGSNFFSQLGFPAAGRNIYGWTSKMPVDANGDTVWPAGYNSSTGISLYQTTVMAALAASATNLANIKDTNFTLSLSAGETSIMAVTVDYGDIQMLRALVAAGQFLGYTITAQNADVVIPAFISMMKTNGVQEVLASYPSLLTLSSSANLTSSKGALTNAIALYFAASDFIRNVRPPGGQYLFNLDTDQVAGEANFRTDLTNALLSLNGPVQVDPPQTFSIDAGNYFSGAKTLRSLMPQFNGDAYADRTLPDYTFGGILVNEPAYLTEEALRKAFYSYAGIYAGQVYDLTYNDSYAGIFAVFVNPNQQVTIVGYDFDSFQNISGNQSGGVGAQFSTDKDGNWVFPNNNAFGVYNSSYGQIDKDGSLYGELDFTNGDSVWLSGNQLSALGSFQNAAGNYSGTWSGTFGGKAMSGTLAAVLTADGHIVYCVYHNGAQNDGGLGQFGANNQFTTSTTASGSTISGTLNSSAYQITGTFNNSEGSGNWSMSRSAVAPFDTPPAITTPPANKTTAAGTAVTFSVTATGSAPLCYQWYCNDSPIAGGTNTSLTISSPTMALNGNIYSVSVNNVAGGTNLSAFLTVTDTVKPTIGVTNLVSGQNTSNSLFVVKGTAGDNSGLTAVWYQLNNGAWTLATTTNGWTNWAAALALTPGTNTLRTYSVDNAGHDYVYVADTANALIRRITPAGVVSTLAGDVADLTNYIANYGYADGTGSAAKFSDPSGVVADGSGNVIVADNQNNLIRKITPAGVATTLAGDLNDLTNGQPNYGYADGPAGAAEFFYPNSVALDGSGNIYVADYENDLIRKITPAGVVSTLAGDTNELTFGGYADGPGSSAQFNNPYGIAVDGSGNVMVSDAGNNLIRKITPDGFVTTLAGDTYDLTNGLGLVNNGYADGPGGAAQFNYPCGIAVDGSNNVIVADFGNNLIRKITPAGVVSTLAGDLNDLTNGLPNYGFADGLAGVAEFANPVGVGVDNFGNVMVADYGNSLIRKMTPAGVVYTLAGDVSDLTNYVANYGYADGTGGAAKFYEPGGVTVDESGGNISTTDTVTFVYVVSDILQLRSTGQGTLSPNYSNQVLQIGTRYTMTATGAAGFKFSNWVVSTNWTGGVVSNSAALNFVMQSNLTLQVNFVDTNKPVLTITNPAANAHFTNTSVNIQGTATDNVAVASVFWRLGSGAWSMAVGTNKWTAPVNPLAGTNVFSAYAEDATGNLSTTGTVSIIYSGTFTPVAVETGGEGTVTPDYNGQSLGLGQTFSMTAAGTNGFVFTSWAGGTNLPLALLTNGPAVTFIMRSNLTLEANFADVQPPTIAITNPLPGGSLANLTATVGGTAADNDEVTAVMYQLNGGAWTAAAGTYVWTATVNLSAGTNVFSAYSVDEAGNVSATNTVGSYVALLQPAIDRVSFSNTGLTVTFPSVMGATYSLVYKNSLTDASWTALGGSVAGTGGELSLSDSSPPATGRFYRLEAKTP